MYVALHLQILHELLVTMLAFQSSPQRADLKNPYERPITAVPKLALHL
jgi:hypothetical protein